MHLFYRVAISTLKMIYLHQQFKILFFQQEYQ